MKFLYLKWGHNLLAGLMVLSCSTDGVEEIMTDKDSTNSPIEKVIVTGAVFKAETRVGITSISDQSADFAWSQNDTIGIFPTAGSQVEFPLTENDGKVQATFTGGGWALKPGEQYAAYYPYSKQNVYRNPTYLPVDMTGQCQIGNNTTAHLSAYDYMASAPAVSENGTLNLTFNHQVTLVRLKLNLPANNTYYSVRLTSTSTPFIIKGLMDITKTSTTVTPEETSENVTLDFPEGVAAGTSALDLTAHMMVLPVDLSGGNIIIDVDDELGNYYRATVKGVNLEKGKICTLEATLTRLLPDFNGHDYVDLGLVVNGQKIFWATMNVGATSVTERGDYFAWGETEPKYTSINEDGTLNLKPWNTVEYDGKIYEGYHRYLHKYFDFQAFVDGRTPWYTKYYNDGKTVLDMEDDAAHVNWGGDWRIPTEEEAMALINMTGYYVNSGNTIQGWTDNYKNTGIHGLEIFSNREGFLGKSIFFPETGLAENNTYYLDNEVAFFVSTIKKPQTNIVLAPFLHVYPGNYGIWAYSGLDGYGATVRAVCSLPVSPRYTPEKNEGFHEKDYNW